MGGTPRNRIGFGTSAEPQAHEPPAEPPAPDPSVYPSRRAQLLAILKQDLLRYWRFYLGGWLFAIAFLIMIVFLVIQLRQQDELNRALASSNQTLLAESREQRERADGLARIVTPADILFPPRPREVAPRPVLTVDDLRWYFETEDGQKVFTYHDINIVKQRQFLENLRLETATRDQGKRVFSTTIGNGEVWRVRIIDAVTIEAVPKGEAGLTLPQQ